MNDKSNETQNYLKKKDALVFDRMLIKPERSLNTALTYSEALRYDALMNGIVYLDQEIDSDCESISVIEMNHLDTVLPNNTGMTVHITSPGGGVYHALAIYDAMRRISRNRRVLTFVTGYAASAATIVMQAGDTRLASPNARFMMHEIRHHSYGIETASEVKDNLKEIEILNNTFLDILSKRCGRDPEEISKLIARKDHWMSAQEAKDWGLIDSILE